MLCSLFFALMSRVPPKNDRTPPFVRHLPHQPPPTSLQSFYIQQMSRLCRSFGRRQKKNALARKVMLVLLLLLLPTLGKPVPPFGRPFCPHTRHHFRYLDLSPTPPTPPLPGYLHYAVYYSVPLSRSSIYQRTSRFPTRCHKTWTNNRRTSSASAKARRASVPCHHAVRAPAARPSPAGGRGRRRVIRPAGGHGLVGVVSLSLPVRLL